MHILGLMSGTSLDGLDMALCEFSYTEAYHYRIEATRFIPYNKQWKKKLTESMLLHSTDLLALDAEYGQWLGEQCVDFLKSHAGIPCDAIASHGHTVFHQPEKGFSLQIGSGDHIAAISGKLTVNDFRNGDIALGGQGAPLVPIGDMLLFSEYAMCLNLGGIANISGTSEGKRRAFDISIANMALNHLAGKLGMDYDDKGNFARKGTTSPALLKQLNDIPFFRQNGPKSLGKEWFDKEFLPLIENAECAAEDCLSTVCEHIAFQLSNAMNRFNPGKVLVTGGGAYNDYLIARIQAHTQNEIIVAEKELISYKEALLFAFLGWLRINECTNSLASVTGASRDACCGVIRMGKQ